MGVRVTFTSAAGAQCAGAPCGYSGTYAWRPRGLSDLEVETDVSHRIRSRDVSLDLGGDASALDTVVHRAGPSGGRLTCTSHAAGQEGFYSLTATRSRAAVDLATPDEPVYGSRCAGPLDGDLATAMPSTTIGLHAIARGNQAIDLRHTAAFAGGGFTGQVVSTLVLHLGRPIKATPIPKNPPGKTHTDRWLRSASARTATPRGSSSTDSCSLRSALVLRLERKRVFESTLKLDTFDDVKSVLRDAVDE